MTSEQLLARSKQQLAEMARKRGVAGWQTMRKDELIKALIRAAKKLAAVRTTSEPVKTSQLKPVHVNGKATPTKPAVASKPIHTNGKSEKFPVKPQRAAARDTS